MFGGVGAMPAAGFPSEEDQEALLAQQQQQLQQQQQQLQQQQHQLQGLSNEDMATLGIGQFGGAGGMQQMPQGLAGLGGAAGLGGLGQLGGAAGMGGMQIPGQSQFQQQMGGLGMAGLGGAQGMGGLGGMAGLGAQGMGGLGGTGMSGLGGASGMSGLGGAAGQEANLLSQFTQLGGLQQSQQQPAMNDQLSQYLMQSQLGQPQNPLLGQLLGLPQQQTSFGMPQQQAQQQAQMGGQQSWMNPNGMGGQDMNADAVSRLLGLHQQGSNPAASMGGVPSNIPNMMDPQQQQQAQPVGEDDPFNSDKEDNSAPDAVPIRSSKSKSKKKSSKVAKQPPVKKEKRRKKDKNKPKRPLSAYNFFFKEEHSKLIEKRAKGESDEPEPTDPKEEADGEDPAKRKKKLTGYAHLAKTISAKWKSVDKETMEHYQKLADTDKGRYNTEMDVYRRRFLNKGKKGKTSKKQDEDGSDSDDGDEF